MKRFTLLKTMLLLCALIVGSGSAWAEEETIASFTASTYYSGTTGGWTMTNTPSYSTSGGGYYQLVAASKSIVTPSVNWSNYTAITITISARKYQGPDATQGKISVSKGSDELASYSPSGTSIAASSALPITPSGTGSLSIACLGASDSKGCGVQSIVIKGTPVTPASPLASIALSGSYPTEFTEGDAFSHEGMTVTATYEDDSNKDVTASATFSGFNMAATGDQTVTVSYTEGVVTKTQTYKITVNALPTHSVTWNINGATSVESYKEGASIDFSRNPANLGGKVFRGWITETIDGTTDVAPSFVTEAAMSTSDITYYAVFATAIEGGEDTYEKITSSTLDTDATYIFGAEQSSKDHTMWYLNSYAEVDKNSTWGVSSTSPGSAIKFTLSGTASSLKAIDESGNYLVPWKTNFRMESEDSNKALFSINDSGVMTGKSGVDGTTDVNFRYNYNNGNGGFRWYDGSTGTQAYLYKVIPGTTYSAYCTSITEPVTISAANYATFCSPYKLDYSGTGVKVYTAKSTGSSVKLTEVEDGIVPANAGVVLYSETADTYNIPVTSAAGSDYDAENNELVGINVRTSVAADGGDGKTNYILSNEDAGVGFYKAKTFGAYLAAHRAYLSTTGAAASRSFLGFDDETTGIETINTNRETVSGVQEYYNLNGQRVTTPTKGLYIVNGKKVIINK